MRIAVEWKAGRLLLRQESAMDKERLGERHGRWMMMMDEEAIKYSGASQEKLKEEKGRKNGERFQ